MQRRGEKRKTFDSNKSNNQVTQVVDISEAIRSTYYKIQKNNDKEIYGKLIIYSPSTNNIFIRGFTVAYPQ